MNFKTHRRQFLKSSSLALAGAACAPWRQLHGDDAASSGTDAIPIVDTHTHFYDPTRPQGVPWPNRNDPLLYRTVLPPEYQALPKPQPVFGTVVVEASPWVEDNQWILDLAAKDPFILGLVGNLPVGAIDFPEHLGRFAANPLFRGIRIGAGRLKEGLHQDPFLEHLNLLSKKDLQLDLLGGPDMLPDVAKLAGELPRLRLVIDHVANLRIDGKSVPAEWQRGMQAAARHPNVFCKVSGLVEGTGKSDGTAPAELAFYRPVLNAVWEFFGEDRLLYGSNWPVSERFADLATVQKIATKFFRGKGRAAALKFFHENAQTVYKWPQK
jgi:L-fuconolactonase